jgi:hypothetical protein
MAPGFTGVSAGPWRTLSDEVPPPEVYLIYEGSLLYRGVGPAPGAIEAISESTTELAPGADLGWSVGEAANLKVSGGRSGDPAFQIHRSPTAGTTWTTPIPTSLNARVARDGDDAYAINGGGGISRTVDSGTIWNEIVAAPSDGVYRLLLVSTTHLYLEFEPDATQLAPIVRVTSNTGGSPTDLLLHGRMVGQVDTGMLLVDMAFDEPGGEIEGPWVLKRFVGSSPTTVTGVPDEFFTYGEEDILAMYGSRGVACHGTTAILVGRSKAGDGEPYEGVIYRSTNKGLAFTEVKRWTLDPLSEKFGKLEVGYAGREDGIWWCGGAKDDAGLGLWRSEDDGLTWTFVLSPTAGLLSLDDAPRIISSGRPAGTSR